MAEGSNWVEIVLLAMLAAFIGLRLVSVLGKRTGHEPVPGERYRPDAPEIAATPVKAPELVQRSDVRVPAGTAPDVAERLLEIAAADPSFDPEAFAGKAKAAYRMILEAFWSGNIGPVEPLVSEEIAENFAAAIEARDGARLPNRIEGIDQVGIVGAALVGQMAEVTMRFVSRVATGDGNGPAQTADIWTFSRHLASPDPAWLLIGTDAEA